MSSRTFPLASFAVILALTLALRLPCYAQTGMYLIGPARTIALGRATTALSTDVGGHANPAVEAAHPRRSILFFAHEAYALAELRLAGVYYIEPTGIGTFSAGASAFGYSDYREMYAIVGYARSFTLGTTRHVYAGLHVRYHRTQIAGYGHARALDLSVGGLVSVLPTLDFGFHATNLNGATLTQDTALPRTLALGISYLAADRLRIVMDAFKDIDFPVSLRGGLEIDLVPALTLRTGVTTNPTRFAAGVGVRIGRLSADVAAEQHLELGWSPAVALGVYW